MGGIANGHLCRQTLTVCFWAMGTGAEFGAPWPSLTPVNPLSAMPCVEQFPDMLSGEAFLEEKSHKHPKKRLGWGCGGCGGSLSSSSGDARGEQESGDHLREGKRNHKQKVLEDSGNLTSPHR